MPSIRHSLTALAAFTSVVCAQDDGGSSDSGQDYQAPISSVVPTSGGVASSKRGLIYIPSQHSSDDSIWDGSNSDLTWYYNYNAVPTSDLDHSKLQFVPMLWGVTNGGANSGFYDSVKSLIDGGMNISYVLGFNEPDGCTNGGSCVDASLAAKVWQNEIEPLRNLSIKLGAPAVTGGPEGWTWLQQFFTACNGNCTPDFIPIHWYGNFDGLASHVGQVNATYENMTMWCTEYGYPEQSLEDTQTFYNQSAGFFDSLTYMTHYSYFGAFRSDVSNVGPNVAFLTQNGKLTDIGAWYLGQEATGNKPKGGAGQIAKFAGWTAVVMATMFYTLV